METKIDPGMEMGGYRIESLLGRGGMAEVYKAWNTGLHRHEALKVLPPQMTFDQSFVERFLNEARMAAKLHHPHIATIHMVSPATETQPYFAMEMVDGGDLADLLHRRGTLPLQEAMPILRQIAGALDYAHRNGIIHRDVKPANVLLQHDGPNGYSVKMVDFGIARAQEAGDGARLTKTGMIVGTPEYMSPEQGGSGAKVGPQSDQYSLTIIAYEMLCGRPPFSAGAEGTALTVIMSHLRDQPRPPVEHSPSLPLSVNNVILRALSKSPGERFPSCSDFVTALESPEIISPAHPASPSPVVNNNKQKRLMPMLIGLTILIGATLIGIGISRRNNNTPAVASSVSGQPMPRSTPDPGTNSNTPSGSAKSPDKPVVVTIAPPSGISPPQLTEQAVNSLLAQWLIIQNKSNVSEYATLYTPDFVGVKRTFKGQQQAYTRTAWLKDRSKMLTSTKNLKITVGNQKVALHSNWAEASFDQYFRTAKYGDWGPKVIKVRATPQGLRIFHEEMIASYPLR